MASKEIRHPEERHGEAGARLEGREISTQRQPQTPPPLAASVTPNGGIC
jgi:hypothetical protein